MSQEEEQQAQYFSESQFQSQQYQSRCTTNVISVEIVGTTHPYFPEIKKLPKNHPLAYYSIQCQSTVSFPLGGGQAGDQGHFIFKQDDDNTKKIYQMLGTFRINNLIQHVIAIPKTDVGLEKIFTSPEINSTIPVSIVIDMQRRLFNMHNHTTQHLLSAIFSQVFKFDTFGWTSGVYNPTPIQTLPFSTTSWQQIQGTLSTIDFTGEFNNNTNIISSIVQFMINVIEKDQSYPFSLFLTKLFSTLSIFLPSTIQQDYLRSLTLECDNLIELQKVNFDSLLNTFGPENNTTIDLSTIFTFEHLALAVESIANFIMSTSQPIEVHIEGMITADPTQTNPEQSTTSMGSTKSSVEADGTVIRQNVSKYSKYAKDCPVPKRFISIGVEKSPCCGTHVDNLRSLQFVSILGAFKHGGRWRISFTPAISALPAAHWSYQLADQLKTKFSCQLHEVAAFVEKNVTIANSLKGYKNKIYNLLGKMLFEQYQSLLTTSPTPQHIAIHYNDSFLSTPDDLTNVCYAMSEACNVAGITTRPILIMTNCDTNDLNIPGIFLFYGSTETADGVKSLGTVFSETLGVKGGGRPGIFQGKVPLWTNFDQLVTKFKDNTLNWSYTPPITVVNTSAK